MKADFLRHRFNKSAQRAHLPPKGKGYANAMMLYADVSIINMEI